MSEQSGEKDALDIDRMFDAIDAAYAAAKALHDAGRCHESEWSCSHCERDALLRGDDYQDADLDPDLPRLLAEARRAHPDAGGWDYVLCTDASDFKAMGREVGRRLECVRCRIEEGVAERGTLRVLHPRGGDGLVVCDRHGDDLLAKRGWTRVPPPGEVTR